MTCSALSKWVEALPFTEIWNRGRQPCLRVEDESDVGYMSWVSCECPSRGVYWRTSVWIWPSGERCGLEVEVEDLLVLGEPNLALDSSGPSWGC